MEKFIRNLYYHLIFQIFLCFKNKKILKKNNFSFNFNIFMHKNHNKKDFSYRCVECTESEEKSYDSICVEDIN